MIGTTQKKTHDIPKRQIFLPSAGFEPPIPRSKRPYIHALDWAAAGSGYKMDEINWFFNCLFLQINLHWNIDNHYCKTGGYTFPWERIYTSGLWFAINVVLLRKMFNAHSVLQKAYSPTSFHGASNGKKIFITGLCHEMFTVAEMVQIKLNETKRVAHLSIK